MKEKNDIIRTIRKICGMSKIFKNVYKISLNLNDIQFFLDNFLEMAKYAKELQKFKKDLKTYGNGAFFLLKDSHPNLSKIFFNLFPYYNCFKINNAKMIIKEFKDLIRDVNIKYPKLSSKEINETKLLFFNKTIKPSNVAITKFPIDKEKKEISEQVNKEIVSLLNLAINYINSHKKENNNEFFIDDIFNPKNILENKKYLNLLIRDIPEKSLSSEDQKVLEKIEKSVKSFKDFSDLNKSHPKTNIHSDLTLIKDYDSFNIDLVRYVYRLHHILRKGNRKYPSYIKISSTLIRRNELNTYLKNELTKDYPNLSQFLINYLELLKVGRNIDAHTIPKLELIDNGKYAKIPDIRTRKIIKLKIDTIEKILNTYASFIDCLDI